jgi:hypothetical protein
LAIIETNNARGLYKDNPKEAWMIITSLKVWIGLRVTALSLTPGNMDLDIHVAGPYGFYDPVYDHLLPEAFAVMTMLAIYISPEMVDKPLAGVVFPLETLAESTSDRPSRVPYCL